MDEASGWADQAMKRMAEEALSTTPHHFAIWYGYYSGEVPDLIRAIDLDIAAAKPFTPARMEELYGKFFSFDREQKAAWSRSMSGALIGFAGAVGALGGVFINIVLRASYVGDAKSATNAFWVFGLFYVVCAVVTWVVFLRLREHQARSGEHLGRSATPVPTG